MKKSLLKLLLAFFIIGIAGTANGQTVLLNEDFSSGTMPAGWSEDSAGVTPFYTWAFNNPDNRVITGAQFDAQFVIFDSDYYLAGFSQDAYLNLPAVNASAVSSLFLVMDEQYRDFTNAFHQIEVSTNSGASWSHILTDTATRSLGYPNPAVRSVYDITSLAAGQSNVRIRFHYAGTYAWWWAIDNVQITDQQPPCLSPPFAGTAVSDAGVVCGSSSFTLNLSNNSSGSGQSYQWQSSPDGITWADISGATTISYTTSQVAATYYQCAVTCSGLTEISSSVFVRDSPIPGNTFSSDIFPCASSTPNFTLSFSGESISGVVYQWQSSPDDINFTDIVGANADTLWLYHTVATYYRCSLSCGGSLSYSASVLVNVNPTNGCYCYPYNPVCSSGDQITEVSFNSLTNTSTCDMANTFSNYTHYPSSLVTTTVDAGMTYNLSVTTNTNNVISVWIDYNRNGAYETNEWNRVSLTSVAGTATIIPVTISSSAFDGITGMRIRSRLSGNPNSETSSCLVMGSGETEDYEITIQNGVNSVPSSTLSNFKIYPSPTEGTFYVDFGTRTLASGITITDVFGRTILKKAPSNSSKETFDISGFSNGIYFVKIESESSSSTQRIILNK